VGFSVLEEPSGRGSRNETKTNENNNGNQNFHSERSHAASLVLAVLHQQTKRTNQTETLRTHITLVASEVNTPLEADERA
jgi:hypothetical protein